MFSRNRPDPQACHARTYTRLRLPPEIAARSEKTLHDGHFFCHVFHQDHAVEKGHDCLALEHAMWKFLDARGGAYPAERNVDHLYHAKPALAGFHRSLDPTDGLNPGIGQTSKCAHWAEPTDHAEKTDA